MPPDGSSTASRARSKTRVRLCCRRSGSTLAIPFFIGFVWAPGWPLALAFLAVPTVLQLLLPVAGGDAGAGRGAAARARAGRRAVAAGHEPDRPRARPDVPRRGQRSVSAGRIRRHSLQLAFYTLVPFYVLAVACFLWLARALKAANRREPVKDIAHAHVVSHRRVAAAALRAAGGSSIRTSSSTRPPAR